MILSMTKETFLNAKFWHVSFQNLSSGQSNLSNRLCSVLASLILSMDTMLKTDSVLYGDHSIGPKSPPALQTVCLSSWLPSMMHRYEF